MRRTEPVSEAPRSGMVPLCAILLSAVTLLCAAGCLNPLPDEQPSADGSYSFGPGEGQTGTGDGLAEGEVGSPAAPNGEEQEPVAETPAEPPAPPTSGAAAQPDPAQPDAGAADAGGELETTP